MIRKLITLRRPIVDLCKSNSWRLNDTSFIRPSSPLFATFRCYSFKGSMQRGPSPPPLPKEDQEEFERLQRQANVSRAFQEYEDKVELEDDNAELDEELLQAGPQINQSSMAAQNLHPDFHYRNIKPDFEGDKNPKTGEVGGPKQDPLRHGDYSFNCRVTDF